MTDTSNRYSAADHPRHAFDTEPFTHVAGSIPSVPRLLIVRGVLGVIAGAALLALIFWKPLDTLVALGLVAGAFFAVAGLMRVIMGAVAGGMNGGMRALNIVFGVLVVVLGVLAIINPGFGLLAVAIVVGVAWLFEGVAALSLLPTQHKGIWIFFGILSIVAGLAIVAFPWVSVMPLVIVVGACLAFFGILDIINGIRIRRAR
jgi:uncharacterized membrane protein HdeD (DUF308 family)